MRDNTPATTMEVLYTFLDIPAGHLSYTWDTGPSEYRHEWNANAETYINGIIMTLDFDYMMGYLIEYVDRTSGAIGFMAIATYHGRHPVTGEQAHDFVNYEPRCGTFFERTEDADRRTVSMWAVAQIYGMIDAHLESQPY